MAARMMTLVAFLQAQNCSNLPGSWRHPSTMLDFLTPEYYQRIARVLEDGKIQMAFFDDRLALPDRYTNHHAEAINAAGIPHKLDVTLPFDRLVEFEAAVRSRVAAVAPG